MGGFFTIAEIRLEVANELAVLVINGDLGEGAEVASGVRGNVGPAIKVFCRKFGSKGHGFCGGVEGFGGVEEHRFVVVAG